MHHSMATANIKKSLELVTNTTAASKYIPRRPRISINWNPPFQTQIYLLNSKKQKNSKNFESLRKFLKNYIFWNLLSKFGLWKGGFQLMLILGLLGMYLDAAVVFVTNS